MQRRCGKKIDSTRKQNNKNLAKRILIVCEGKKTEPNYFRVFNKTSLKSNSINITIEGAGKNTLSLVEAAVNFGEKAKNDQYLYSEIWCVFDKDDFSEFNNAIKKASDKAIKVAYSNPCFEFWYILHFEYLQTALHRDKYKNMLTSRLKTLTKKKNYQYQKNSKDMYDILLDNQETAINNAKKLLEYHKGKTCSESDPSTTVHKLIQALKDLSPV
ncbi:MAG: RloB domain-containing protein [bacterium]|nr:RloB domain-containing protein [bacterium]